MTLISLFVSQFIFCINDFVFVHGHLPCSSLWSKHHDFNIKTNLSLTWKVPLFHTFCKIWWYLSTYDTKTVFYWTNNKENMLLVPQLHEIWSIPVQLQICKGQNVWKYGSNRQQKTFNHNTKGDFHIFHILNIFHFYSPNSINPPMFSELWKYLPSTLMIKY